MQPMQRPPVTNDVRLVQQTADALQRNVARVIVGHTRAIRLTTLALFCGGHVLIEDMPGEGKTMMAKAFARSLGNLSFARIQSAPDKVPSDITGYSIPDTSDPSGERFRPGPIFAHVVLVDEQNLMAPRTLTALHEAMEEGQVTPPILGQFDEHGQPVFSRHTYKLPAPHFVLATQNPHDDERTYALGLAQRDRYLVRVRLGEMTPDEELALLTSWRPPAWRMQQGGTHELPITPVLDDVDALFAVRQAVWSVRISDETIRPYLLALFLRIADYEQTVFEERLTHRHLLMLQHATQAWAAMEGRAFVTPDDVKAVFVPVCAHCLDLKQAVRNRREQTVEDVLDQILEEVPVDGTYAQPRVGQPFAHARA